MSRPQTFATLWVEGPLGPYERLVLTSFVRAGERVELHTYDSALAVPAGVVLCDARDIVSDARRATFPGGFTHFSNFFRYRLLNERACVWFDTDLVLLDAGAIPDQQHLYGRQSDGRINTALLALPHDSPALAALVERSDVPPDEVLRWGRLGPDLLTSTLEEFELLGHALDPAVVYPITWQDNWRLFDPGQADWCRERTRGSAGLHLWNQYLKKDRLSSLAPHLEAFLGRLATDLDVDLGLPVATKAQLREVRRAWAQKRRPRRDTGLGRLRARIESYARRRSRRSRPT